ncbi:MAG: hypothetical protein DRP51_08240 [Candidatus Zixiibacteriota bacterium]|nr:MAG: hypothetical protein DRP51_08240 [candidate division Zixibacteria bacterium]
MALDKKNKVKKSEESEKIVGLDDGELKEEGEGNGEKGANKNGLLDKYKKFILPTAIALGAFVISIVGVKFLNAPSHELSEDISVEESGHSEKSDNIENEKLSMDNIKSQNDDENNEQSLENMAAESSDAFSIDTSAIMDGLAFLDYTPEMEAEEKKQGQMDEGSSSDGNNDGADQYSGMTPQDSVDTLNWLDKELNKLDKAKAVNASTIKKLQALEYKIDQALKKIEQAESARIINLARLYDGMRPEQVGKLFENLNDKAVLAILPRMKSANAAKIMAIMPPKRAARISTKMITVLE